MNEEYDSIEDYPQSPSDALWILNRELESRAAGGDLEAIRYLNEMWRQEMSDYPTYLTGKASRSMEGMSARKLYEILCDSLSGEVMGRIDYALNAYVGQTAEQDHAELDRACAEFEAAEKNSQQILARIRNQNALDPEWREALEVEDYAADHGLTEDEARNELEAKAYWT